MEKDLLMEQLAMLDNQQKSREYFLKAQEVIDGFENRNIDRFISTYFILRNAKIDGLLPPKEVTRRQVILGNISDELNIRLMNEVVEYFNPHELASFKEKESYQLVKQYTYPFDIEKINVGLGRAICYGMDWFSLTNLWTGKTQSGRYSNKYDPVNRTQASFYENDKLLVLYQDQAKLASSKDDSDYLSSEEIGKTSNPILAGRAFMDGSIVLALENGDVAELRRVRGKFSITEYNKKHFLSENFNKSFILSDGKVLFVEAADQRGIANVSIHDWGSESFKHFSSYMSPIGVVANSYINYIHSYDQLFEINTKDNIVQRREALLTPKLDYSIVQPLSGEKFLVNEGDDLLIYEFRADDEERLIHNLNIPLSIVSGISDIQMTKDGRIYIAEGNQLNVYDGDEVKGEDD